MEIYDEGAALYDIAFSWDVGGEVDWLLARLGPGAGSVLEPGCGSGRMFPDFVRRGVEVVGVDQSPEMLARAAARMREAGLAAPRTLCADMADFDAGGRFDGAICPINTFGYLLTDDSVAAHLRCVARHLRPGARYLVQVDLGSLDDFRPRELDGTSSWEMERDGIRVRATVAPTELDPRTGICIEHYCFEVLEGPEAGYVLEEHHPMRLHDWRSWSRLIAESPFEQTAAYDGDRPDRPALALGPGLESARLTWHELRKLKTESQIRD